MLEAMPMSFFTCARPLCPILSQTQGYGNPAKYEKGKVFCSKAASLSLSLSAYYQFPP